MAIKGNLRDMSLPSLMQVLCLEHRHVGLMISRQSERGTIYFDSGHIVHATAGSLEGEAAVYQILSWSEGSFSIDKNLTAPRRTINSRFDQLMMEGAKRLDELERDRSANSAPKHFTAEEVAHDSRLENEIITLISVLEQAACRLSEKSTLKRPASALQILVEMTNESIVAMTAAPGGQSRAEPLKTILSKVAETFPTAQSLPVQNARLSVTLIVNLFDSVDQKARQQFFSDACRSLIGIMDACFANMTSRFRSAVISEGLKEATNLFLADLSKVVGIGRVRSFS